MKILERVRQPIFQSAVVFFTLFACLSCSQEKGHPGDVPMYGYDRRPIPPEEQAIHDRFIREVVQASGSRDAALRHALARAWQYYDANDPVTAMKRFNQAWLLDNKNAEVFLGFAFLMSKRGKDDESIRFNREALSLNPHYELAMTNLAQDYIREAMRLGQRYGKVKEQEYLNMLAESEDLLQVALQAAPSDEKELSYIYYKWAVVRAMCGDFVGAWEKVHLSRKHGGAVESGFIDQLSRDMPEPKD